MTHSARPLVEPIVQSTTYRWNGVEDRPRFSYAREGNPTVAALEDHLAGLEGGMHAACFGSGLAAIDAVLRLVPAGGRVILGRHLYGGTTRLATQVHDLQVDVVDSTDNAAITAACDTPADLIIVETPSNPTLRITDLRHVIVQGHRAGALVAIDNTFLTPLYQQPLALGADISIHSTTKYIDGHDATLGGAVIVNDAVLAERLRWLRLATGAVLAPFEAWITLQGCKTLALRTRQQWTNARAVADALAAAGLTVHYPGHADHPGHDVHRSQSSGDGGIVAVDLGTADAAAGFVDRLQHFTLAENLGATESLVSSPALMTHAALGADRRAADGIGDGLVRLSCGIEETDSLVADVLQAIPVLA